MSSYISFTSGNDKFDGAENPLHERLIVSSPSQEEDPHLPDHNRGSVEEEGHSNGDNSNSGSICENEILMRIRSKFHSAIEYIERKFTKAQLLHYLTNLLTAIFLLLPIYFTIHFFSKRNSNYIQYRLVSVSAIFVALSLYLSFHEISNHLTHMYHPTAQKFLLRILFMVPIYSLQNWLSLWPAGSAHHASIVYLEPVRDLYEAYAISSFLYYLVALAGGEEEMIGLLRRKANDPHGYGKHRLFPFSYLCNEWEMGEEFLLRCKHGVLLFVTAKLAGVVIMVIFKPLGLYGDDGANVLDFRKFYVYVSLILSLSMSWALYCLYMLYMAIKEEMKEWNLIGKFLCIKGIVFFTFWQGFVILVLQHFGCLNWGGESTDAKYIREDAQALLICVEMLGFAIAHRYTFTYREYCPSNEVVNSGNNRNNGEDGDAAAFFESMREGDEGLIFEHQATENTKSGGVKPMSASNAFWSAMPNEEITDIKRLKWGAINAANKRKEQKDDRLDVELENSQTSSDTNASAELTTSV